VTYVNGFLARKAIAFGSEYMHELSYLLAVRCWLSVRVVMGPQLAPLVRCCADFAVERPCFALVRGFSALRCAGARFRPHVTRFFRVIVARGRGWEPRFALLRGYSA